MKSILILHGALGSADQLKPVQQALQTKGHTVHLFNFSGHGGEPFKNNFGIEQFTEDSLQHLNDYNLKQVTVFGYSMGGYVALWLAHLHPERVDRVVTLGTKFDWSVASATQEIKKLKAEKILEKIPAFARILEHRHAPNDWKVLLQKTADMMMALGEKPILTKEILQTIQCPTVIGLGDSDDMADRVFSEQVTGFLPKGKFSLLENTPHPIEKVDLTKLTSLF